ncbi:MAG: Lpg1974 family pore-forming outer membrane protein [Pseudomonadota bacterium]
MKRTFDGIGPRLGFDATMPLADSFALDVGVAGALLFGKQKLKVSGSGLIGGDILPIDVERSKTVTVPNLEASAALSWLVAENAKFSLGYRVDSYFGVYDVGATDSDHDKGDRIMHGPFIKLTIGGGG